jgi:Calcineurin-like phosphoesterase
MQKTIPCCSTKTPGTFEKNNGREKILGVSRTLTVAAVIGSVFLVTACTDDRAGSNENPVLFRHDIATPAKPWTNEDFDNDGSKFTFALFSDLTGGEREHIFEVAVAQLALLRPELILSIGDLIEGGTTDRAQLSREWESFDARASQASAPIFRVGGNHDLTHIVMREFWEQRFGARYYHFIYKNVLFLILDTEDNTQERMQEIFDARTKAYEIAREEGWGALDQTEYMRMPEQAAGNIGAEQSAYLQQVIAANPDVRWTFLFMHKAPWLREDEENFAAIEQALADRPYTVFHGHAHAYLHEKRLGRDYIRLATTGGVQFPGKDLSIDHVTMVTVSEDGVTIANLRLSGIFDQTGHIPLGGDSLCFDVSKCAGQNME